MKMLGLTSLSGEVVSPQEEIDFLEEGIEPSGEVTLGVQSTRMGKPNERPIND
jgi:hypothetical protein